MTVAHRAPKVNERTVGETVVEVCTFSKSLGMTTSSVDDVVATLDDMAQVSSIDVTGSSDDASIALLRRLGVSGNAPRPGSDARPRLEPFSDHALATVLIPTLSPDSSSPDSLALNIVDVVITDRFLLFAHAEPLPFRDRIKERAAQHPDLVAADSAFLLFILLDEWLLLVELITEEFDERIEDMEERAIRDTSGSFLDDLVDLKELGFDLSQAVDRHHAVFDAMLNPDFPFVAGEIVESHYRDLSRRFERRVIAIKSGRESINNAFNIFSSSTALRTNRIIILLTMVSTVLMPMTVIFSFFGTNFVDLPLFTTPAFIAMCVTVAVVTTLILTIFARRGWLQQGP